VAVDALDAFHLVAHSFVFDHFGDVQFVEDGLVVVA
jgi:hypothetical protein